MAPFEKLKNLAQKLASNNPKMSENSINDLLASLDFYFVTSV
jgi:hypothetical protein